MKLPVPIVEALLPTDWPNVLAMAPELAKAYATRQIFRTETEARISVLDDIHFPTRAAKYWQCVREQCVMAEQLALLSFEWRRNELQIHGLKVALNPLGLPAAGAPDFIEHETEARINMDECLFRRMNMLTVAKDRARELAMWSKIKAELDDGSFDTENVDAHQLVSYTTQFFLRFAHADQGKMTAGEMDNLSGQLRSATMRCIEVGAMDAVLAAIPENLREGVRKIAADAPTLKG